MLTFEDFFLKKKIDLLKLQVAEPALFAAFSKHYPLMGEKSFDHAKKYWFNQLRRTYPLDEIVKPHPVSADAITNLSIQSIAVAAAQNLDAGIEKPKFKEDELVELADQNIPQKDISLAEAEQEILQSEPETPKPAFKPRFNPKNIPQTVTQPKEERNESIQATDNKETDIPKPVFKPRFNMQNIKKEVVKTVSDPVEPAEKVTLEASEIVPEVIIEETAVAANLNIETSPEKEANPDAEAPKPAYKPRFKMQQTPQPATEHKPDTDEIKPSYKPRFEMKNIKKPTKPEE